MDYKIVTSRHASDLAAKVNTLIAEGYKPVGSHQVVTQVIESRYQGQTSIYQNEYSQTMVKE